MRVAAPSRVTTAEPNQMPASYLLLQLLGQIALLLWGIHMVQSGVERAWGGDLRRTLGRALSNRFSAFLAGVGVTAVLQSSTAIAMMATSFTAGGAMTLVAALAVMLGANVGTTLIVQVLSFDVTAAYPVLILAGLVAFRRGVRTRTRDLGRVGIGLGLILLSLDLLAATIGPVEESAVLQALFGVLTRDPVLTVAIAAAVAWAAHASVAAMLLVMSLAAGGALSGETIIALVLGANLGSALNPLIAALGHGREALRLPVGNLINRLVGVVLVLAFLGPLAAFMESLAPNATRLAVDVHTGFNVAMAALFILPLPWIARLLERILPDSPRAADPSTPQYLDDSTLQKPTVALANAAREVLRMADVVEEMLQGCRDVLHEDDRKKVSSIGRMDDVLGFYSTAKSIAMSAASTATR